MSQEPKPKRRKMEPSIGGDENNQESSTSGNVHSSKTILKAPTGSPSGDFGVSVAHQYLSYVSLETNDVKTNEPKTFQECQQPCDLGDSWSHKYPLPLSKYPNIPVRTGNLFYDGVIGEIETVGFKPLQVVAKGRSGAIVLAQNILNGKQSPEAETIPVALKLNSGNIRRNRLVTRNEVTDEMNIHKHLHHPNIVSWISNISLKGRYGIAMEFCENGNLEQLIKIQDGRFLAESISRRYFRQIHSAVDYIHQLGFAHRDICLQNVLVSSSNVVKLSDFGHSVPFSNTSDQLCDDDCGSNGYQAPEILQKKPYNPRLSDIWSLGALLYSMCIGRMPFGVIKNDILVKANKEVSFPEEKVMPLSLTLKDLLKAQLTYIPEYRYSMNRIAHHEWMTTEDNRLQIGNFHKVRQPQKTTEGNIEAKMKQVLSI